MITLIVMTFNMLLLMKMNSKKKMLTTTTATVPLTRTWTTMTITIATMTYKTIMFLWWMWRHDRLCLVNIVVFHHWLNSDLASWALSVSLGLALNLVNNMSGEGQKRRQFTYEELRMFDGREQTTPIYVALNGNVFDVTDKGKQFYGPGSLFCCYFLFLYCIISFLFQFWQNRMQQYNNTVLCERW